MFYSETAEKFYDEKTNLFSMKFDNKIICPTRLVNNQISNDLWAYCRQCSSILVMMVKIAVSNVVSRPYSWLSGLAASNISGRRNNDFH
jgi:hypothetical protein